MEPGDYTQWRFRQWSGNRCSIYKFLITGLTRLPIFGQKRVKISESSPWITGVMRCFSSTRKGRERKKLCPLHTFPTPRKKSQDNQSRLLGSHWISGML
ncbi:hypothetical protein TNCV_2357541 [Trichonephila clavipes]|nr:hypothetical protein TNCV_2357541 [Trichonephila clavipes]